MSWNFRHNHVSLHSYDKSCEWWCCDKHNKLFGSNNKLGILKQDNNAANFCFIDYI